MATTEETVAARTGEQFLDGLRGDAREIWLNGEKITHPLEHPALEAAARTMARVYDLQHEHADEMLAPAPDTGALVNVTHLIPRSKEDLERRRRAVELTAALTAGMMGRTPDYLNVTFACFAGRSDVWARRGNDEGAANIVAYQREMRDRDLSTTHSIMNPQVDRTKPEAEQAAGEVALHKIGETESHITVRGARMLATLAPYADELTIYPGSDIRPQDGRYALSFAIPMGTPGLKFICRDSYSKERDRVRLPALVAVRRDGRGGDLRRRRGAEESRLPRRRHGRLLRGHLRHRAGAATSCTRRSRAPTSSCRSRSGSATSSPTRPAWGGSTTSRRSSGRCGTWSS